MKTTRRWQWGWMAGIGLGLATATGCQTWTSGMTLPSPQYLKHPPQYFAPSPAFPLSRELTTMEAQEAQPLPGAPGAGGPLPAQVPPGFGPAAGGAPPMAR